jgi:hypothetical protein
MQEFKLEDKHSEDEIEIELPVKKREKKEEVKFIEKIEEEV